MVFTFCPLLSIVTRSLQTVDIFYRPLNDFTSFGVDNSFNNPLVFLQSLIFLTIISIMRIKLFNKLSLDCLGFENILLVTIAKTGCLNPFPICMYSFESIINSFHFLISFLFYHLIFILINAYILIFICSQVQKMEDDANGIGMGRNEDRNMLRLISEG